MHHDFLPLTLAALFDLNVQPHMIAIVVPLAGLIFAGAIVASSMYFENRRRQMWHETARLALEKGQPLPPFPGDPAQPPKPPGSATNDIRSGLISLATGAGLFLFLDNFLGRGLACVAAIPAFVGVALLLFGVGRMITGRRQTSTEDRARPL
jgi:Domain of unknown function (DUF6249)